MLLKIKKPKKSSDHSKIKNKSKNKTVGTYTPVTLPPAQVAAQPLPNLQYLRGDAYIQSQVEQRLKNLVEDSKSGTKIKSLRGGSVEWSFPIELNGRKNMSWQVRGRNESSRTSYL